MNLFPNSRPTLTCILACYLLSAVLFPGQRAHAEEAAPLSSIREELRRIVQEELAAKEAELKRREYAVTKHEAELRTKAAGEEHQGELQKVLRTPGPLSLAISGYGDLQADFYDREENRDQPEGARGQSKTVFDTERFVLELEAEHEPSEIEIEAEIEFEHGGTGSAQEIEFEEFGEFESEVEKGGEVIVEELYIEKDFGNGFSGKLGRFYVALNTLSSFYTPLDYLGVRRPEVEEVMLPGQWDEIGISLEKEFSFGRLIGQIVNGLDSTGFGAAEWVASGHQSRFEGVRAEDLALVARVEVDSIAPELLLGAAIYLGNSSGNRPKDDLDVDGLVSIGSVNFRYWGRNLKSQGALYLGHLSDAEEISERNARLSNALGVPRTPVADGALGLWSEIGFDIASDVGLPSPHELLPFFRFDYYDTYFDTRENLVETGRYERNVYTSGIAYRYDDFLTLKLNWSRREFGDRAIAEQDLVSVGAGFVY